MRRIVLLALLGLFATASTGCVMAVGNKGSVRTTGGRYPVAMNGEIYLVDVGSGEVQKIAQDEIATAETYEQVEVEVSEDDD